MGAVNVRVGPLAFDPADYDADGDVLHLHIGPPREREGDQPPRGTSCASRLAYIESSASRL
jgi:hypothetical protein